MVYISINLNLKREKSKYIKICREIGQARIVNMKNLNENPFFNKNKKKINKCSIIVSVFFSDRSDHR